MEWLANQILNINKSIDLQIKVFNKPYYLNWKINLFVKITNKQPVTRIQISWCILTMVLTEILATLVWWIMSSLLSGNKERWLTMSTFRPSHWRIWTKISKLTSRWVTVKIITCGQWPTAKIWIDKAFSCLISTAAKARVRSLPTSILLEICWHPMSPLSSTLLPSSRTWSKTLLATPRKIEWALISEYRKQMSRRKIALSSVKAPEDCRYLGSKVAKPIDKTWKVGYWTLKN